VGEITEELWREYLKALAVAHRNPAHPDQDAKGVFVFNRSHEWRIDLPFIELGYTSTNMPDWSPRLAHKTAGSWFLLRLGPFPNGAFTEIPVRQQSERRRPQDFCPKCQLLTDYRVFIAEDTGEATCLRCMNCRWPGEVYKERVVLWSREVIPPVIVQ
jgi:hypothetical protein